jgi:hypothetical protein
MKEKEALFSSEKLKKGIQSVLVATRTLPSIPRAESNH